MTTSKAGPDPPLDPDKGAAGKEPAAEESLFLSPWRERVVYAYCMVVILGFSVVILALSIIAYNEQKGHYMVHILGFSVVILVLLIIAYNEQRDRCH